MSCLPLFPPASLLRIGWQLEPLTMSDAGDLIVPLLSSSETDHSVSLNGLSCSHALLREDDKAENRFYPLFRC